MYFRRGVFFVKYTFFTFCMKRPLLTGLLILLGFLKLAASENYPAGARALALSNAFVSVSDTWSTFHNQAGLAGLSNISAGFFYESRFMTDELSLTAVSMAIPLKAGTFGLSFSQFGKGAYKEQRAGLAFAKELTKHLSAAVQIDYFSEHFPENSNAMGYATFEAGVIYNTGNNLFFGAHIFNPVMNGFDTPSGFQKMPTIFKTGGHYRFPKMVLLVFEAEKIPGQPVQLKTGIEFSPVKNVALRFGASGKPVNLNAGIGFQKGKITTDIAFYYHGILGLTPAVSLQINLQ